MYSPVAGNFTQRFGEWHNEAKRCTSQSRMASHLPRFSNHLEMWRFMRIRFSEVSFPESSPQPDRFWFPLSPCYFSLYWSEGCRIRPASDFGLDCSLAQDAV